MSCKVCEFTETHGYSPGKTFHCDDCHRSWTGHAEAHCTQCCRHFSGDSAFQAHRVEGECRDPSLLKDRSGKPRFKPVMRKDGFVWVRNVDFDASAFGGGSKAPNKKVAAAGGKKASAA